VICFAMSLMGFRAPVGPLPFAAGTWFHRLKDALTGGFGFGEEGGDFLV
jgi:hypothetical protein